MSMNTTPFITSLLNLEANYSQNGKRQVSLLLPDALRRMKQAEDTAAVNPSQPGRTPAADTTSVNPSQPGLTAGTGASTASSQPASTSQTQDARQVQPARSQFTPIIMDLKTGPATSQYLVPYGGSRATSSDVQDVVQALEYAKAGLRHKHFSRPMKPVYGFTHAYLDTKTLDLPESYTLTLRTSLQFPYSRWLGLMLTYTDTPPQVSSMFMPYDRIWFADVIVPKPYESVSLLRNYIDEYRRIKGGGTYITDSNEILNIQPDPIAAYGIANAIAQEYVRASIWGKLTKSLSGIRNIGGIYVRSAALEINEVVRSLVNDNSIPEEHRKDIKDIHSILMHDIITNDPAVLAVDGLRLHSLISALIGNTVDRETIRPITKAAIEKYSRFLKAFRDASTTSEIKNAFLDIVNTPLTKGNPALDRISNQLLYFLVVGPDEATSNFENEMKDWKKYIALDDHLRRMIFGEQNLIRGFDRYSDPADIYNRDNFTVTKIQFNSAKYYIRELSVLRTLANLHSYTADTQDTNRQRLINSAIENLFYAMTHHLGEHWF